MVDHEDRSAADKFSVSRLRRSMRGTNAAVPSSVHGAPQVRGRGANRAPAQPAAAWLHCELRPRVCAWHAAGQFCACAAAGGAHAARLLPCVTCASQCTSYPASTPPSAAEQDAEESRETLGRLKRMAGFEAQDFDPEVGAGCSTTLRFSMPEGHAPPTPGPGPASCN